MNRAVKVGIVLVSREDAMSSTAARNYGRMGHSRRGRSQDETCYVLTARWHGTAGVQNGAVLRTVLLGKKCLS